MVMAEENIVRRFLVFVMALVAFSLAFTADKPGASPERETQIKALYADIHATLQRKDLNGRELRHLICYDPSVLTTSRSMT